MTVHNQRALEANASARASGEWERAIRAWLIDAYQFTRFAVIGCSVIFPILGAATAPERVSVQQALLLAVVAISFHVFAYVLNDVIDLPIDRTEPLRAADPLVRGVIRPRTALAIALAQLPLMYALTASVSGTFRSYATLSFGIVGMSIYNWYGKRTRAPFLTDVVQGIAWTCLAAYGASFAAGGFTRSTALLAAAIVVYIVMINGVHGALRDLGNDHSAGARTTAMLLGARHDGSASLTIPPALQFYAALLQIALIAVCGVLLADAWNTSTAVMRYASATALLIVALASVFLLLTAARRAHDKWGMVSAGMFHLFISFATLMVPLVPKMSASVLVLVVGAYVLPVAVMLIRFGVRWG